MSNRMKEKIVITGASGFLGSNLIERLKNYNCEIYAFTSNPQKLQKFEGNSNIKIVLNSDIDTDDVSHIFKDSIVINCAFPRANSPEQIAPGLKFIDSIFRIAVKNGAKGIINISSQSLYPINRMRPASENTELELTSPYEVGKFMVEQNLEAYCYNSPVKFTNIRLASLIGPGFDQRITNKLVDTALSQHKITVEDNNKYYGYLDVEDATSALLKMIFSSTDSWREIYNLGPEEGFTLKDIGESVQKIVSEELNLKVELEIKESEGTLNSTLDSDAFRKDFIFNQQFMSLDKSIEKILVEKLNSER